MYAVIRAGGKQYRVAPGDVIKVEKTANKNGTVEFNDILAVSGNQGKVGKPGKGALVTAEVLEEGRADKILVFKFKRKKQYKKMQGHRQAFTALRITEINFDGQSFKAPDAPARKPKKGILDKAAELSGTAVGMAEGAAELAAGAMKPKKAAAKKPAKAPAKKATKKK